MPNWKKLIVSGSDAALNSLTVSTTVTATSVTASLFGTASWARNALTASFFSGTISNATTASYAATSSWAINSISSSYALTASNSQNASDILLYVKNISGAQINKGTVVRISGSLGDNALIAIADYTDDNNSANTLGLVTETLPNDSFGYVMTEGTFLGYDTLTPGWVAGQVLYLGSSGSITGSAPRAPLHSVRLGQALRVQQINGSLYVRIDNGYELGELHDIIDTTTNTSYGDLLVKSGSIWTNSKQLTGSYGLTGSLTATQGFTGSLFGTASNVQGGAANYIPLWNTNSTLSSSVMYQSSSNIGIGTTSPQQKLVVSNAGSEGLEFVPALSSNSNLIQSYNRGTSAYNTLVTRASDYNLQVGTTSVIFVSASGNIGIGTITPNVRLEVAGLGRFTGTSGFSIGGDNNQNRIQYSTSTFSRFALLNSGNSYTGLSALQLSIGGVYGDTDAPASGMIVQGNVGIGTTSPSARLHISGSTNSILRIESQDGSDTTPTVYIEGNKNLGSPATATLVELRANDDFRGRGIHMTVSGSNTRWFAGVPYTGNGYSIGYDASSNGLPWYAASSSLFINTSRNVGIGTTTPAAYTGYTTLAINNATNSGLIDILSNGTRVASFFSPTTTVNFGAIANIPLLFLTNNNERMRISNTGDVGIGTTSPNARFDVSGSAIVSGSFTVAPSNAVELQVASTGVRLGNVVTDAHTVTGSLSVSGSVTATNFTGSLFGTSSWASNAVSSSFALSASWAPVAGTTVFPYTGSALFTGSIILTGSFTASQNASVGGNLVVNDSVVVAGSTFSGSTGARLSIISGTLSIAPYTSSGMIRVSDASGWPVASNYTYPQLRLPDYRTGITLVSNNEVHIVCDSNGVMSAKSGIGNHFVNLDSTAWLRWSTSTTNGFTHDIVLKRESAGVLAITGSVKISGSLIVDQGLTSSFFGTASWANNALTASNVLGGAANYIPLWNGATSLSSSVIYQSSGNVGIGTTTPGARLDVSGSAIISGSFTVSPSNAVELQVTSTGVRIGNSDTDVHQITGSVNIKGDIIGAEPIPAGAKLYLYYNY